MERDEDFIRQVAQGCDVGEDEVRAEWDAVASDTFVSTQIASGAMNEEQMLEYIKSAVHSRFTSLAPADSFSLVVIGYSGSRKPRSGGDWYSELFVLVPSLDNAPRIRRINVTGDHEIYKNISFTPPTYFEGVRLVSFPDGGFQADRRANFDEGTLTDPEDDYLAFVPRIRIADVPKNLAKRRPGAGTQTWEDPTDWRAITGMVVLGSTRGAERADGSGEWGMFEVNDRSLMSPISIDAKTTLTPALTCWCPREIIPTDESIVTAYGTISKVKPAQDGSRPGGYSMNVKRVEVIVRREVEDE